MSRVGITERTNIWKKLAIKSREPAITKNQQVPSKVERPANFQKGLNTPSSPLDKMDKMNLADYLKKKIETSKNVSASRIKTLRPSHSKPEYNRIQISNQDLKTSPSNQHILDGGQKMKNSASARNTWQESLARFSPRIDFVSRVYRPNRETTLSKVVANIRNDPSLRRSTSKAHKILESEVLHNEKFKSSDSQECESKVSWKNYIGPLRQKVNQLEIKFPSKSSKKPIKKPILTGEIIYDKKNEPKKHIIREKKQTIGQKGHDLAIKNMPIKTLAESHNMKRSGLLSQSRQSASPGSRNNHLGLEEFTFRPQFSGQRSPHERESESSKASKHLDILDIRKVDDSRTEPDSESSYILEEDIVQSLGYAVEHVGKNSDGGVRGKPNNSSSMRNNQISRSDPKPIGSLRSSQQVILPENMLDTSHASETKTVDKFNKNRKDESYSENSQGLKSPIVYRKSKNRSNTSQNMNSKSKGITIIKEKSRVDENSKLSGSNYDAELPSFCTMNDHNTSQKQHFNFSKGLNKTTDFIKVKDYTVFEPWTNPSSSTKIPIINNDVISFGKILNPSMSQDKPKDPRPALKTSTRNSHEITSFGHLPDRKRNLTVGLALPNNPNTPCVHSGALPQVDTFTDALKLQHFDKALFEFDDADHRLRSDGSMPRFDISSSPNRGSRVNSRR